MHGNHARFRDNAAVLRQTPRESAIKLAAINCHKTQLKLSRTRFVSYAGRLEGFLAANGTNGDLNGEGFSNSGRKWDKLEITLPPIPRRLLSARPKLWILGHNLAKRFNSVVIPIRARSRTAQMSDYNTGKDIAVVECHGNLSTGLRVTIPEIFSTNHSIYAKLERRGSFFDDFGWIEVQKEDYPSPNAVSIPVVDELSLAFG